MSRKNPNTRTRILDAAWTLLESGAARGVRMSDIAKAAGISRQALYLHFPSRAELLVATTRHVDEVKDVDARLAESRAATGPARLDAFIAAWGGYIPEVQGVLRALAAMMETDAEARAAYDDRMAAVRHGCAAAVAALGSEGGLTPDLSETEATDLLWALLSVETWGRLTRDCGWSQNRYVEVLQQTARAALLR